MRHLSAIFLLALAIVSSSRGASRVNIRGQSKVRLNPAPSPAGVGGIDLGTLPRDKVRLQIAGGALVCRRDFIHAGEADGSEAEILIENGALHDVNAFYLGGSGKYALFDALRIREAGPRQ